MWKEVISIKDMEEVAVKRTEFGCAQNLTIDMVKNAIERKVDCHFYIYKSDTIELVKGFKDMGDHIYIISYSIKADIKDYPEALKLMAEKSKEYLKDRKLKKMIIGFGSQDETQVNFYNKGIQKLGLSEVIKLAKIEYEKLGFKLDYLDKQIICEL